MDQFFLNQLQVGDQVHNHDGWDLHYILLQLDSEKLILIIALLQAHYDQFSTVSSTNERYTMLNEELAL